MNSTSKDYIVALFLVSGVMSCLLFTSAYSQSASNNSGSSSSSNQSTSGNTSSQGIGSAQELSQVSGNNTEIIVNDTSIGNPNASLAEKMSSESNATGNQTNETDLEGVVDQSGNQTNPLTKLAEGIGKAIGIGK
jgi:hypothetical protein